MNVLIIGSGAREHAMVKALARSPREPVLYGYGAQKNPGMAVLCYDFQVGDITDVEAIVAYAKRSDIALALIGPEAALAAGVSDALWAANIPTVGPHQALARIETSKQFARDLMKQNAIPGLPCYQVVHDRASAQAFLEILGEGQYVIKADGLMGGKGVKVAGDHLASIDEALEFCDGLFEAKKSVLIEEKLVGQEFSFMVFSDGEHIVPMPLVQDHKRAYVNDKGPNTGGMGSYSCADHCLPFLNAVDKAAALTINKQVLRALTRFTGLPYRGILYGSFIATASGVSVIEFNARFGDPEALNVLSILQSDFLTLCEAMVTGQLTPEHAVFSPLATVCKYVVPKGYPDAPLKETPVHLDGVSDQTHLFLGAVEYVGPTLVATGSRTAATVGIAASLPEAEQIAETEIKKIQGDVFHREDIGTARLVTARVNMMQALRAKECV